MPSLANDLNFGKCSETLLLPILAQHFETELEKTEDEYSAMDFTNKNKTIWVELKTRRIAHNQYPTALISASKIGFCNKNPMLDYYFVYQFTDGLYYVKYDKALFETFDRTMFERSARADARSNMADTVFIPSELLIRIDKPKMI